MGEKYHLLPVSLKGKVEEFKHDNRKLLSDGKSFDLPVFQKFRTTSTMRTSTRSRSTRHFRRRTPRKEFQATQEKDKKEKKDELPLTREEKKEQEKKRAEEEKKRLEQEKQAENVRVVLRTRTAGPP